MPRTTAQAHNNEFAYNIYIDFYIDTSFTVLTS